MRSKTADLAKGIAVLCMIQVHLMELFAQQNIFLGTFGKISLFLGGPVVAPVFMAIMGYFIAKSNRSTSRLVLRGLGFIVLGFLLNIALNAHLFYKIYHGLKVDYMKFIFGVDILLLAGISIILLALLRNIFANATILYLLLACSLIYFTPYITNSLTIRSPWRYFCAFVGGRYSWSYFPIFPWFAYSLLGYSFSIMRKNKEYNKKIKLASITCLFFLLTPTIFYAARVASNLPHYYHHSTYFAIWVFGFFLFWFPLLSLLEEKIGSCGMMAYIKWLGRNVTALYVLQWILIGNIATAIYKTQTLVQLILWYVFILIIVSLLAFIYEQIKLTWKESKKAKMELEETNNAL